MPFPSIGYVERIRYVSMGLLSSKVAIITIFAIKGLVLDGKRFSYIFIISLFAVFFVALAKAGFGYDWLKDAPCRNSRYTDRHPCCAHLRCHGFVRRGPIANLFCLIFMANGDFNHWGNHCNICIHIN